MLAGIELPKRLEEAVARRAAMKTSHDRPQGAVTKELNTLRKILLAIAVEKFDHQHGKGAAGRISAAAQRRGISVSDDTVRKHLDEAMASLDQDQKADLFLRKT
ncbi:hypothetical protein RKLH11_3129 [Rhodobacteraceae bacterium KLH11]|nr:hypothetical protein RKLH11_3129 [Rhodobacteraceae bacterium KLH11]